MFPVLLHGAAQWRRRFSCGSLQLRAERGTWRAQKECSSGSRVCGGRDADSAAPPEAAEHCDGSAAIRQQAPSPVASLHVAFAALAGTPSATPTTCTQLACHQRPFVQSMPLARRRHSTTHQHTLTTTARSSYTRGLRVPAVLPRSPHSATTARPAMALRSAAARRSTSSYLPLAAAVARRPGLAAADTAPPLPLIPAVPAPAAAADGPAAAAADAPAAVADRVDCPGDSIVTVPPTCATTGRETQTQTA